MTESAWLTDIIVINETSDPRIAGDVQVYRNATDMSFHLEHWYVADVEYVALDGLGRRLVLGLDGDKVIVTKTDTEGQALLHGWLLTLAQSRRDARIARAAKKRFELGAAEASGTLPATVEGLIAYLGFARSR